MLISRLQLGDGSIELNSGAKIGIDNFHNQKSLQNPATWLGLKSNFVVPGFDSRRLQFSYIFLVLISAVPLTLPKVLFRQRRSIKCAK